MAHFLVLRGGDGDGEKNPLVLGFHQAEMLLNCLENLECDHVCDVIRTFLVVEGTENVESSDWTYISEEETD